MKILDVDLNGAKFKIEVDTENGITGKLMENMVKAGLLYEVECHLLAECLKPGDRFLDVGAHIGFYSLVAASVCERKVKVDSFEPNITNYLRLLRNIDLNEFSNITPHCMAVGCKAGVQSMYVNADNDGGHAFWDVAQYPSNERTREIKPAHQLAYVTTIGKWVGRMTGRLWVKLDVEGFEQSILETFPFDCGLSKSPVFIVEINDACLEAVQTSQEKMRKMMQDRGYHSWVITEGSLKYLPIEDKVKTDYVYNMIFAAEDIGKSFPDFKLTK